LLVGVVVEVEIIIQVAHEVSAAVALVE